MSTIRTFIAVEVSKPIQASAVRCIQRLEASGAGYNWVTQDNLHVTLNYAGDIDEMEITPLCRAIKAAAQVHDPFSISVRGMGGFPEPSRPRSIWLGVEEGADELTALHRDIASVLHQFRVNKEKNEFLPHLTLGRVRRSGRWNQVLTDTIERMASHEAGDCFIDQVVVCSSHLDRMGPTYSIMSTIKLLGEESD